MTRLAINAHDIPYAACQEFVIRVGNSINFGIACLVVNLECLLDDQLTVVALKAVHHNDQAAVVNVGQMMFTVMQRHNFS